MNIGNGYQDISNSPSPIFGAGSVAQNNNAETLWEPGKTQIAYLAIKNNGNLVLKDFNSPSQRWGAIKGHKLDYVF